MTEEKTSNRGWYREQLKGWVMARKKKQDAVPKDEILAIAEQIQDLDQGEAIRASSRYTRTRLKSAMKATNVIEEVLMTNDPVARKRQ